MAMLPTVLKLNSQIPSAIVMSQAAATSFSNISLGFCIRLCGVFYKLGRVTSSTSFHILSGTMAAGRGIDQIVQVADIDFATFWKDRRYGPVSYVFQFSIDCSKLPVIPKWT